MKKRLDKKDDLNPLRKKAEEKLLKQYKRLAELSALDSKKLLHELGTYQIELEMQNEELRQAQMELQKSHNKYIELYDSAPVGYFVLTSRGSIRDVNLTGANMLAVGREFLINKSLYDFILDRWDRDALYIALRRIVSTNKKETLEMKLTRPDGSSFYAQIESTNAGNRNCHSIVSDITYRKKAEIELHDLNDQLKKLSAHMQTIVEEKRSSISREIHDELGQNLTAIKMDLSETISQLSENHDNAKSTEILQGDVNLINKSIQSVKRICARLRPQLLDHLGLEAAMEWQIKEFEKGTGIRCNLVTDLKGQVLSDGISITIFRLFQEALTNIRRHANATLVQVSIKKDGDNIFLSVHDNGKGIVAGESEKPGSFGLISMRERVRSFGGKVAIDGVPGKGTTITVSIPSIAA